MVVQPKKHEPSRLRICVNFRELNKVTLTNPFPTPFADEVLNEVACHECYPFTNGFSWYNEVPIATEDQNKMTFLCEIRSFAYTIMLFELKNTPVSFSRIVVKEFHNITIKLWLYISTIRKSILCLKTIVNG